MAHCLPSLLFSINETRPGAKMQQLAVKSISLHCYYRVDISLGRRVLIRDDRRLLLLDCQTFFTLHPMGEAIEADWNMES